MSLSRGNRKYLLAIAVLSLVLGIKIITGHGAREQENDVANDELSLEHYMLDADVGTVQPVVRDIFSGRNHPAPKQNTQRTLTINHVKTAVVKPEPTVRTDVQVQAAVADSEIDRLKLLGIVFHDNKRKAFLALDKQRVIADVGDLVYGRYLLREIAVDSATLVDTNDNLPKTILVSGK